MLDRRGGAILDGVLTRSQVAKRLKKSIATVRRLEDYVLFPVVGRNDVRFFDEEEVDELRRNPDLAGEFGRSEWFESNVGAAPMRKRRDQQSPSVPNSEEQVESLSVRNRSRARLEAVELLETLVDTIVDSRPRDLIRIGIDEAWIDAMLAVVDVLRADARDSG